MHRFVRRGQQRWPALFLYGEPLSPGAAAHWRLPEVEDDDFSGIVTFSSGQEMEDFWDMRIRCAGQACPGRFAQGSAKCQP